MTARGYRIIQVSPSLPPNLGGVNDYAGILGETLERLTGGDVEIRYVCAGRARERPPADDYRAVDLTGERSAGRLMAALMEQAAGNPAGCAVLLNYVGYGYDRNGTPRWLLNALREFRRACPDVGLTTMFHELYATSRKPWERPFWTARLQRRIARGLADLSDRVFTTTRSVARPLRRWRGGEVPVHAVFSTVGEPETNRPYSGREPVAILFGSAGKKRRAYRSLTPQRVARISDVGIRYIVDVGPPVEGAPRRIGPLSFEPIGVAAREVVSDWLSRAALGLYSLPPHLLTKSTILAAYLAHGLPAINFAPPGPTEGLLDEDELVFYDRFVEEVQSLEALAPLSDRAWEWYQAHAHSRHMAAAVLAGVPGVGEGYGTPLGNREAPS